MEFDVRKLVGVGILLAVVTAFLAAAYYLPVLIHGPDTGRQIGGVVVLGVIVGVGVAALFAVCIVAAIHLLSD
jgi:hypothetical protein